MKPKNTICLPTSGNFFQRLWRCRLAVVRMARTALAVQALKNQNGF